MSSSIKLFAIDVRKVAAVCGANKTELISEIRESEEELFEYADEDDDPDLLSLEDSIRAVFQGDYDNEAIDYMMVAEVLCSYFGTEEILDSLQEAKGGYIEQLEFLTKAFKTPIPLPFVVEDSGEHALFIDRSEISSLASELDSNKDAWPAGEVFEANSEFLELLKSVENSGADLIGFCL